MGPHPLDLLLNVLGAVVNNEIVLFRWSYYLPKGSRGRFWALDLKKRTIQEIGQEPKKNQISYNGAVGPDFQGFLFLEKTLFSKKVWLAVYTVENEDFLFYDGSTYQLDKLQISYQKTVFFDKFKINHNKENIFIYKYFRPIWRKLLQEDRTYSDDIYPLKYCIQMIEKRSWKKENRQ